MDKIKQYLIRDYKVVYKFVSVQIAFLVGLISYAEPYMPQLQQYLPAHWVPIACGIIIFSRMIQQKVRDDNHKEHC